MLPFSHIFHHFSKSLYFALDRMWNKENPHHGVCMGLAVVTRTESECECRYTGIYVGLAPLFIDLHRVGSRITKISKNLLSFSNQNVVTYL